MILKILITGIAGFIGSNLAKKIVDQGDQVIGIDNFSYGCARNIEEIKENRNFTFIFGDLKDELLLNDIKADLVVHLASLKIPRYTSALKTLEENNILLKNVLQYCLKNNAKLIFASTSDVYGKNNIIPFSEDSDLTLGPSTIKRWAYAVSKIYGEQLIIANSDEFDLKYTILRFFGSYGPNQNITWWGGPQSVFIQNILEGKPLEIHGDGKQTRTFTYVDDTVQGILKCIYNEKANNKIYNIASNPDQEIMIKDLGYRIIELMNGNKVNPGIRFIPYSTFGKYEDVMRRVPDISKIKTELNFQPQYNLDEGLKITIEWQKKIFKNQSEKV